jgi:hypothetical protein
MKDEFGMAYAYFNNGKCTITDLAAALFKEVRDHEVVPLLNEIEQLRNENQILKNALKASEIKMNNEHILRIAEESGMTQYVAANNKFLERFAHQIIEECKLAVNKDYYRHYDTHYRNYKHRPEDVDQALDEYFGLKEK